MHLKGYPEILLYIILFIGILFVSQKFSHKKIVTILSIIIMSFITFSGIMGLMVATGYITV